MGDVEPSAQWFGAEPGAVGNAPGWRARIAREFRVALSRRRLAVLPRATRGWLALLAVTTGASAALIVAAVFGAPLLVGDVWWRLTTGLICLAAYTTALAAVAMNWGEGTPASGGRHRWSARMALGLLGLGGICVVLLRDVPVLRATRPAFADVVGLGLWTGLACCAYALLRRPAPAKRHPAAVNTLLVIGGPAVAIAAVAVSTGLVGDTTMALQILGAPLVVASLAAVCIVPTILVRAGLDGLATARERGDRVAQVLRENPRMAPAVLASKAVLLVAVAGLVPVWLPGNRLVSTHPMSWVAAFVTASLVVLLLWFEQRGWPAEQDHRALRGGGGLLVAVPLGVLAGLAGVAGLIPVVVQQPWPASGLALVVLLTWAAARWAPDLAGWFLAAVTGLALATTAGRRDGAAGPPSALPELTLDFTVLVLAIGLGVVATGLVVTAIATRRFRLLAYLAAVVVWIGLNQTYAWWTPGVSALDIDLALTALLLAGLLGFMRDARRRIDPAEAIAMAVVVFLVMDVPVLLRFAPPSWAPWVLAIGVVAAVVAAFWSELPSMMNPTRRRDAMKSLGLTCLAVALTAALVWTVGSANVNLFDDLVGVLLGFVSLPLAVLLASQTVRLPVQRRGT